MNLEERLAEKEDKESCVLIVDDEEDVRKGLRNLLGRHFSTIIEASNGKEAIIQVQKYDPDVIIFDIKMPDMDGIKMAKGLDEIGYGNIPRIALSGQPGYCSKEDVEKLTSPIYYFEKGNIKDEMNILELTKNLARYRKGMKDKERIKYLENVLKQHLGPTVAAKALRDKSMGEYTPANKTVSILITDIKDFTNITHTTDEKVLFNQLKDYVDELTSISEKNTASIVKYRGDGILTFWGAPYDEEHHVWYACNTAIWIKKKVAELNNEWQNRNLPRFETRIGISSGQVLAGNIGRDYRYNYEIFGDCVNIAARCEELNKIYGTTILMSEHTFKKMPEDFTAREIDEVILKGIKEPIKVYELIDYSNNINDETRELIKDYSKALSFYKKKMFGEAFEIFYRLAKRDAASKTMLGYVIDKIKNQNE